MSEPTTFRRNLLTELVRISNEFALTQFQQAHPFLEAKSEMLEQIASYYTDTLLEYAPFCSEFSPDELADLRSFAQWTRANMSTEWSVFRERAARLLESLNQS